MLGAFLEMLPGVIRTLSKGYVQDKEEFCQLSKFLKRKIWEKAQMLQQHAFSSGPGKESIIFPNRRYFEGYHKDITEDLTKAHQKAFSSKSFSEFLDKRLFWIYMRVPELCQCKKVLAIW